MILGFRQGATASQYCPNGRVEIDLAPTETIDAEAWTFPGRWRKLGTVLSTTCAARRMLSLMGKAPDWMRPDQTVTTANEDEFVETVAALLFYARNAVGIQFTLVSPINEPDMGGVEGLSLGSAQSARIFYKLAVKLDAIGMNDIRFVAPDAASALPGYYYDLL